MWWSESLSCFCINRYYIIKWDCLSDQYLIFPSVSISTECLNVHSGIQEDVSRTGANSLKYLFITLMKVQIVNVYWIVKTKKALSFEIYFCGRFGGKVDLIKLIELWILSTVRWYVAIFKKIICHSLSLTKLWRSETKSLRAATLSTVPNWK